LNNKEVKILLTNRYLMSHLKVINEVKQNYTLKTTVV